MSLFLLSLTFVPTPFLCYHLWFVSLSRSPLFLPLGPLSCLTFVLLSFSPYLFDVFSSFLIVVSLFSLVVGFSFFSLYLSSGCLSLSSIAHPFSSFIFVTLSLSARGAVSPFSPLLVSPLSPGPPMFFFGRLSLPSRSSWFFFSPLSPLTCALSLSSLTFVLSLSFRYYVSSLLLPLLSYLCAVSLFATTYRRFSSLVSSPTRTTLRLVPSPPPHCHTP